jgi:hypothetical protein
MNPLKKQNSFEQQLKESLDGMEFKPSDTLWDKIAQNMGADTFEPKLQNKLQDFIVDPKEETWEQLEAQLPEKKKRFGWIWLSSVLLITAIAGGISLYQFNQNPANEALVQTEKKYSAQENKLKLNESSQPKNYQSKNSIPKFNLKKLEIANNHSAFYSKSKVKNKGGKVAFGLNQTEVATKLTVKSRTTQVTVAKNESNTKKNEVANTLKDDNIFNKAPVTSNEAQNKFQNQVKTQPPTAIAINFDNQNIGKEIVAEKTSSPPKSLLDSQLAVPISKSNVYMESDLDLSKLSIVANIGMHLSFMQLMAPKNSSQNLDKTLALRKEIEVPEFDFSANLSGEYAISERLYVRAGVGILSFTQDVKYNLTNADSVPQRTYGENFYLHNTDSIIVGATYSTKNKYSFTEIPVWIGYKLFRGQYIGLDLNLGVSYGKLNLVNAYLPDQSCVGLMVISDKASFPTYKNMWFLNVAPAVTWQMNTMLDVGLMPQLRVGINNMVSAENWIGQRPWSVGLNLFLRKRF